MLPTLQTAAARKERLAMMTPEEIERENLHTLKGIPDALLHPSVRDGKLYGKQLQNVTTADLKRHLIRCSLPTCPSPAHHRGDLKGEVRLDEQARNERAARGHAGMLAQNTRAPGSSKKRTPKDEAA